MTFEQWLVGYPLPAEIDGWDEGDRLDWLAALRAAFEAGAHGRCGLVIGQIVTPTQKWLETHQPKLHPDRQIPERCEILGIEAKRHCANGWLVLVAETGGYRAWIDSGWFEAVP
jgi:hypothetical protein